MTIAVLTPMRQAVEWSNPPAAAASTPNGLSGMAGPGKAALTWDVNPYATGFRVRRNGVVVYDGPHPGVGTEDKNRYHIDTGLTNGTAYSYTVSAYNAVGESAVSAAISITPRAVVTITATQDVFYTAATLLWTNTALAGYTPAAINVRRDGKTVATLPTTAVSYTDVTLYPTTTYQYMVVSRSSTGVEYFDAVNVTSTGTTAPYFVNKTDYYSAAGELSAALTIPAFQTYDCAIMLVARTSGAGPSTAPAGWVAVTGFVSGAAWIGCYFRRMQRGDSTALTLPFAAAAETTISIMLYRGCEIGLGTTAISDTFAVWGGSRLWAEATSHTTTPIHKVGRRGTLITQQTFTTAAAAPQTVTPIATSSNMVIRSTGTPQTTARRTSIIQTDIVADENTSVDTPLQVDYSLSHAGTSAGWTFWLWEPRTPTNIAAINAAGGTAANATMTVPNFLVNVGDVGIFTLLASAAAGNVSAVLTAASAPYFTMPEIVADRIVGTVRLITVTTKCIASPNANGTDVSMAITLNVPAMTNRTYGSTSVRNMRDANVDVLLGQMSNGVANITANLQGGSAQYTEVFGIMSTASQPPVAHTQSMSPGFSLATSQYTSVAGDLRNTYRWTINGLASNVPTMVRTFGIVPRAEGGVKTFTNGTTPTLTSAGAHVVTLTSPNMYDGAPLTPAVTQFAAFGVPL